MVSHAPGRTADLCPHVERNDVRCSHRFSLGRLDQAFAVCMGAFHGCPMFHRINREVDGGRETHDHPLITVTTHGRHIALRPTGT